MRMFPVWIVFWMSLAGCSTPLTVPVEVRGSLRQVMHDHDLSAKVRLDTLLARPHLYALGAVENLDGEIIVRDGNAETSSVRDSVLKQNDAPDIGAAMLVFSYVERWDTLNVTSEGADIAEIENQIDRWMQRTHREGATAFQVLGMADNVQGHVVTPAAARTDNHQKSGFLIDRKNCETVLLGFYSTQHQGIFTHHDSKTHIHFQTPRDQAAGHLDAIAFFGTFQILLPSP